MTGEQFEIRRGPARAVITEVGAGLRSFEVAGVPYVESFGADERPPAGAGCVLVPWPNRVAGGVWSWRGVTQRLALTEPRRGHAIHGLTRYLTWRLVDHTESVVILETTVNEQPGWPVALTVRLRYELDSSGLVVAYTLINIGAGTVPFGVGAHPYPRAGEAATDDCELRLAAQTMLDLDEQLIPTGVVRPVPEGLRTGQRLAGVRLDTPFGGVRPDPDGLVRHRLSGGEVTVELWADQVFRWVQVYTPDDFPGRGRAVAIEPMTCPPDALNSGTDLIELAPGQRWSARWGLTPRRRVAHGTFD